MAVLSVDIIVNDNGSLAIRKVSEEAKKAEQATGNLSKSTNNLGSSFSNLSSTLKGVGLAALAYEAGKLSIEAVKTADSMKLLEARINLTSTATDNYKNIQIEMTRIAKENGVALQSVGNLYSKMATSLKPLGISTQSVMTVTDAFSKSLLISGASTEEASSATLQFAQAMASGRLQGDEFRSMAENSPRFMKAMTDSLGKTSAEIRQMAEDGKLTTSVVGGALVDSMAKLREEARGMPMTVGKAFNELKTEATLTVEQFDKLTGINDTIAKGFQAITDKVVKLREELPLLSAEMTEWEKRNEKGIYTLKALGSGALDLTAGALKMSAEGWGKIADWSLYGAGKAGEALGIVNDDTLKYVENQKKVQAESAKTAKAIKDMAQDIEDGVDDYIAKGQFKNVVLPEAEVKKRVEKALESYALYYKTIGDNETYLSIKRQEYAEKYKDLNAQQIDQMIKAESDKLNKVDKHNEEWTKRKKELAYEIAEAEQDVLAKPYIELEKKYNEDLEKYGKFQGAKELIDKEYYAKVNALNKKTVEDFNKKEEEKAKKAAEWQVKLFEANEKINDQIIAQRERMYGATSEAQIESWYQNQLEWLGKLALEGKATSEELQGLLEKIDSLKELKLKEQTISFKLEKSFYDSFENGLADSIEDAFNGTLNLRKFFKTIQNSLTSTIASSLSSSFVNSLRSGGSLLGGVSALAVGSAVSASEISSIMNSGGTFDSATNTITTSGGSKINVGSDGSGTVKSTGSDVMSLVNTISTLKTAYTVATQGLSNTIMGGFMGASDALVNAGFVNAGTGVANFGAGFANPFSYSGASSLGSVGAGLSSGLIGGAVGYGTGWLGDKLLGANSYASVGGLAGGALGGIGASLGMFGGPVGIIAGSLIGSALGGIFGKKKTTDTGIQFFENMDSSDTLSNKTVRAYQDWEKKGWFSKSSGTELSDLSSSQMKQIEAVFDTYDYLLAQLGDSDKISLEAGKYSGESFADALTKNFITAFTDVNQNTDSTIYQAWKDYAESIDTTVTEAFASAISAFVSEKRTFEIWQVGADSIEGLSKKAQFAKEDFDNLANSLGVNGVTVENYLERYNEAVKSSFTPETIASWKNLGDSLMSSTDAARAYQEALDVLSSSNKSFSRTFELWASSSDMKEQLKLSSEYATQDLEDIKNKLGVSDVKVDNFLELYKKATDGVTDTDIIEQWQKLGSALISATDAEKKYKEAIGQTSLDNLIAQIDVFVNSTKSITIFEQLTNAQKAFKDRTGASFNNKEDLLAYEETLKKKEDLNAADIALYEALYNALVGYEDYIKNARASIDEAIGVFDNKSTLQQFKEAQEAFKSISGETIDSESSLRKYAEVLKNKEDLTEEEIALYEALCNALVGYEDYIKNARASIDESMASFDNKSNLEKFKEAQEAFKTISGETIDSESSLKKYGEVLKNKADLTDEEIASYQKLSSAMLAYKNELLSTYTELKNSWSNISSSFKSAYEALNPKALQSWDEIANTKLTTENYQTVLDSIEKTRQAQINSAQTASDAQISAIKSASSARIDSLNKEKDALGNIISLVDSLNSRIFESASTESYYKSELAKARLNPKNYNYSALTSAANSYADYAKSTSINSLEYYRQVAKMSDEISSLKSNFTAGTLEGIEAAIKAQEASVKASEYATTRAVQDATNEANKRASELLKKFGEDADSSVKYYTDMIAVLNTGDAAIVLKLEEVKNAILDGTNITLGNKELHPAADITLGNKEIHPAYPEIYLSEKTYLDGSHANGLDFVPFDGYRAELHKGERVQTASEVKKDAIITELKNEIQYLKEVTLKTAAETTRTAKLLDRLAPDGDALQVRITA